MASLLEERPLHFGKLYLILFLDTILTLREKKVGLNTFRYKYGLIRPQKGSLKCSNNLRWLNILIKIGTNQFWWAPRLLSREKEIIVRN